MKSLEFAHTFGSFSPDFGLDGDLALELYDNESQDVDEVERVAHHDAFDRSIDAFTHRSEFA